VEEMALAEGREEQETKKWAARIKRIDKINKLQS
jgi:hypothetical protein